MMSATRESRCSQSHTDRDAFPLERRITPGMLGGLGPDIAAIGMPANGRQAANLAGIVERAGGTPA
jgi:hypothetical protein